MAKVTMSTGFPGAVVNSTGVLIPWATLKDLDQAELTAADDINVFVRAFIEGLRDRIVALPDNQKPTRMTIAAGTQTTVAGLRNALNNPYTITFTITGNDGMEMVVEPA